jgi:hypothetical protein
VEALHSKAEAEARNWIPAFAGMTSLKEQDQDGIRLAPE